MRTMAPVPSYRATAVALALLGLSLASADLPAQSGGKAQDGASAPDARTPLVLPPVELRKLANGIEVAVMRDTRQPVVAIGAVLDVGPALDPAGKAGLAELTKAMLSRGTTTRSAGQIATAAGALAATVGSTYAFGPVGALDSMLVLLADQLLHPAFRQDDLARLKTSVIADVRRGTGELRFLAPAIFKSLLYGPGHPYARRLTEESIAAVSRDDVAAFHAKYIRPPNVRFAVAGDVDPDSIAAKLDARFGTWQAGTTSHVDVPAPVAPVAPAGTTVYFHDRPGAEHGMIWIGGLGPRRDTPDYAAISVMNTILGGSLTSRLNGGPAANPRKRNPYTPVTQSGFAFQPVPEAGVFAAFATTAPAKTDSVLVAMMRELRDIREARSVTVEEFGRAHGEMMRQLSAELASVPQRMAALMDLFANKLPLDTYTTMGAKLAALTRDDVQAAARAHVTPDRLAIVVVGDRAAIEPALRAANVAPVVVVDLDGRPVKTP
jgi:zinc protease